jgi:hypothetical protein
VSHRLAIMGCAEIGECSRGRSTRRVTGPKQHLAAARLWFGLDSIESRVEFSTRGFLLVRDPCLLGPSDADRVSGIYGSALPKP